MGWAGGLGRKPVWAATSPPPVRTPEGSICLYTKGADTVILERLRKKGPVEATTEEALFVSCCLGGWGYPPIQASLGYRRPHPVAQVGHYTTHLLLQARSRGSWLRRGSGTEGGNPHLPPPSLGCRTHPAQPCSRSSSSEALAQTILVGCSCWPLLASPAWRRLAHQGRGPVPRAVRQLFPSPIPWLL